MSAVVIAYELMAESDLITTTAWNIYGILSVTLNSLTTYTEILLTWSNKYLTIQ